MICEWQWYKISPLNHLMPAPKFPPSVLIVKAGQIKTQKTKRVWDYALPLHYCSFYF